VPVPDVLAGERHVQVQIGRYVGHPSLTG
jgi:hypothetical protein